MNILTVTAWPPTEEAGGVNAIVRVLSKQLSGAHGVHVLVDDWNAAKRA